MRANACRPSTSTWWWGRSSWWGTEAPSTTAAGGFAAILCAIGLVVTLLFFQLEIRNAELVDVGREALAELERAGSLVAITVWAQDRRRLSEALGEGLDPFRRTPPTERRRASWRWRTGVARHAFVLRSVMVFGGSLFLLGLGLALVGAVPGQPSPTP